MATCPFRTYPLRKPNGHKQPIPKFSLTLPEGKDHIYTAYVGIQQRSASDGPAAQKAVAKAVEEIESWIATSGARSSELFTMEDGGDKEKTLVWVCYWLEGEKYHDSIKNLDLGAKFSSLEQEPRSSVGLWLEAFVTPSERFETNYSGLDYLPGLGRMPGTGTAEHDLSAYWGAARDRIPGSADDLFEKDDDAVARAPPPEPPVGLGQHLVGTNYHNVVHIRSGQWWEKCSPEETAAYEDLLEPTLIKGLEYLWDNPRESGALGVRYLRNKDGAALSSPKPGEPPKKETCGVAFFDSMSSMERWAKSHPSHLAIYGGAMKHYKRFQDNRLFRTWHEVSVLREGDARFEYVNCTPRTGVIRTMPLEVQQSWV